MTTVSGHVLHLPLAATILCRLPALQLLWDGNAQSDTDNTAVLYYIMDMYHSQNTLRVCLYTLVFFHESTTLHDAIHR